MRSRCAAPLRVRCAAVALPAILAGALALLAPPRAQAHDPGLYISFKLGTTDVDANFGEVFDQVVEGDDDSETIEVGYRWSRHFAIQGGYHDFGKVPGFGLPCDDEDAEVCLPLEVPIAAETKAYSLSIVPQLPLGKRLSVFGKLGVVALETEVRDQADFLDFARDVSEEDVIWGAGLRLGIFGPIQIFYEYEGIGDEFETQSFGATWQF
jgi:hypothetical protein